MKGEVQSYHPIAKILHWGMAALIIGLLVLGHFMEEIPKGTDLRLEAFTIHKAIGVVALLLALARIGWRLTAGAPAAPASLTPAEQRVGHLMHLALYVLMIAMPLAGILMSQAGGHPVALLGVDIPNLIGKDPGLHEMFEDTHGALGWVLAVLVFVHAAAALRHHYQLRDDVMKRMLPGTVS
ncbi:MAG: cytochrome b [Magnetospirillum sp.]|nr:cytochrome b [Magnetospirillum sp.]